MSTSVYLSRYFFIKFPAAHITHNTTRATLHMATHLEWIKQSLKV